MNESVDDDDDLWVDNDAHTVFPFGVLQSEVSRTGDVRVFHTMRMLRCTLKTFNWQFVA